MSRIDIALVDDQRVMVTAELDLTRAFGSADAYFAASQWPEPMAQATIASQLASAAQAIELTAGNLRIDLVATDIQFERFSLAEYRSPLTWPRATVTFTGALDADATPDDDGIRVRFVDTFVFEEPIATTLQSARDDVAKSRWLVTFQSSPVLQAPQWFGRTGLALGAGVGASATTSFARYFGIGFWHIIPDGIDHLLFVFALVLAARSLWALLLVLSVYTAAHSLSFAAAALGWLPTAMLQVESLIVVSIVVAALASVRSKTAQTLAPVLAFGFGLLHGLGFANALTASGLPTEQRLVSLLGFNIGVESAQLLWVLLLLPIWWCCRNATFGQRLRQLLSLGIAFVALWWLLV